MASSDRRSQSRRRFLDAAGWGGARLEALAADASFRRYFRLHDGARRVLLMDAPPPHERTEPFAALATHLLQLGLSAPRVLAADHEAGWLLLEDFGDATFTRLLDAGHDEAALYELACDTLLALQGHPHSAAVDVPPYDLQTLLDEALLFVDWFMPAALEETCSAQARDAYVQAWHEVLEPLLAASPVLVLRDYHVDNLMLLEGRTGVAACGLLDFQDARLGHPAYDVASLLEDARRDLPVALKTRLWRRCTAALAGVEAAAFERAFNTLAAQRHAKVAGIFVRLWRRDRKPAYLRHIPRVLRYLHAHLDRAELAPVARWFECHAGAWQAAGARLPG